jgi:hypothetical protein
MTVARIPGSLSALLSLRWAHDRTRPSDSTPDAPRDAELLALEAGCEDYCEREVDEVECWVAGVPEPGCPPRRPNARLDAVAAALDRWRPVALAGLDPVAAAVRPLPGPAPGHRLGTVHRPSFTVMGDHPEAAARERGERFGVVGRRSWHGSRLQDRRGPSTACWQVLSLQLRSGGSSSPCAPVGLSGAGWNDKRNDRGTASMMEIGVSCSSYVTLSGRRAAHCAVIRDPGGSVVGSSLRARWPPRRWPAWHGHCGRWPCSGSPRGSGLTTSCARPAWPASPVSASCCC